MHTPPGALLLPQCCSIHPAWAPVLGSSRTACSSQLFQQPPAHFPIHLCVCLSSLGPYLLPAWHLVWSGPPQTPSLGTTACGKREPWEEAVLWSSHLCLGLPCLHSIPHPSLLQPVYPHPPLPVPAASMPSRRAFCSIWFVLSPCVSCPGRQQG